MWCHIRLIWVISLGMNLWLVYFRWLRIYKKYHNNAKYMKWTWSYLKLTQKQQLRTGYNGLSINMSMHIHICMYMPYIINTMSSFSVKLNKQHKLIHMIRLEYIAVQSLVNLIFKNKTWVLYDGMNTSMTTFYNKLRQMDVSQYLTIVIF